MPRTILSRWKFPTDKKLESFPFGKPNFGPFPTVTELTNTYYCPLAIYHYLHHGEFRAFIPRVAVGGEAAGDIFHKFIAHLKMRIKEGELQVSSRFIYSEFLTFGKKLERPNVVWESYLQPWINKRMDDLKSINARSKIYFEITVASDKIQFRTKDGGRRTYPSLGRIDEINLDKKQIIERTIRSSVNPKDYQVWLLWKILCSIDKSRYPKGWQNVNFKEFELVVETPEGDFFVEKNNSEFEYRAHEGYAWLNDLTFDPRAIGEAYNERSCTYGNRRNDCGLAWICYIRKQPFPTCRNEMRRVFKDNYRALLWEKIWNLDRLQYQFVKYTEEQLEEKRLLCKGKIISSDQLGKNLKIKISSPVVGPAWVKGSDEIGRFLIVPFGNLSIGLRLKAIMKKDKQEGKNVFSVIVEDSFTPFSKKIFITALDKDFLIFEDRPKHLITTVQRDMHRLEFRGVKDQNRSEKDSKVQLLECIFGRKNIRRGES